ncbi:MAG: DUF131 domain-containing protein [Candidatus Micrarchaeota archaeon]
MNLPNLELTGVALIFTGLFILAASIYLQQKSKQKKEAGGILLAGPFPIPFGSMKSNDSLKTLSLIGFAIAIAFSVWLFVFR